MRRDWTVPDDRSERKEAAMRKPWVTAAALVTAMLIGGATVGAFAALRGGTVNRLAGGAVTKVAIANSNARTSLTNTVGWVNLPGASVVLKVPTGRRAIFIATFSANTRCSSGGFAADECDLRIMVDANQMSPGPVAPNDGAAFDSHGLSGDDYLEMHAIQRARSVAAGRHVVQVQVRAGPTEFQLDAWQLTVESAAAA
jgi:hypothetical protein